MTSERWFRFQEDFSFVASVRHPLTHQVCGRRAVHGRPFECRGSHLRVLLLLPLQTWPSSRSAAAVVAQWCCYATHNVYAGPECNLGFFWSGAKTADEHHHFSPPKCVCSAHYLLLVVVLLLLLLFFVCFFVRFIFISSAFTVTAVERWWRRCCWSWFQGCNTNEFEAGHGRC